MAPAPVGAAPSPLGAAPSLAGTPASSEVRGVPPYGDEPSSTDPYDVPAPAAINSPWLLPSQSGALGLFETSSAEVGPNGHLRLGIQARYFESSGFLVSVNRNGINVPDSNSRMQGQFTFGLTLFPEFELFGALYTSSNRNVRPRDATDRDPEVIKAFGDFTLGGKYRIWSSGGSSLAFEGGLKFLSSVTGLSISPDATSLWLGPIFTYDAKKANDVPLRFHANTSFYWDRSGNLPNWAGVPLQSKEVAQFAYGIAESRFRLALALDMPLEKYIPKFPLLPFLEYHLEIATGGADTAFADYMSPKCPANGKTCRENRDMQWLTFGLRASVYQGLTAELGVDVRLRSVGFPYGPPIAPYNIIFGLAYPFDIASFRQPRVVTRTVERVVEAPAPVATKVVGMVRNKKDGSPIVDAIVSVVGRARGRYLTDSDGGFEISGLPPGPCGIEVKAKGFDGEKVQTSLSPGRTAQVEIQLNPHPEVASVHGRVTGPTGGVAASLRFIGGAEPLELRSGSDGTFAGTLPPGHYQIVVEASGLTASQTMADLQGGQDPTLDITLKAARLHPEIVVADGLIKLKSLSFPAAGTGLSAGGRKSLDGLAEVLADRPDIHKVRIEAHTDGALGKDQALALTTKQAEAVRDYLVKKGVAAARLEAVGAGSDRPLVPNLGPANRAKNRRVELHFE